MTDTCHAHEFQLDAEGLPELDQDDLARILDEYLLGLERGAPLSPEELCAKHPRLAPYLQKYLSSLNLFHEEAVGSAWKETLPICRLGVGRAAGERIGDFEIVREIGRGGMGVVYEAQQTSLRRRVALKVLPFSSAHDEQQIARFKNEAQAAAQIRHPNIVPVYAIGEEGGVHYYAMQLIEGQSLTTMLEELQTGAAPSSVGTTAPNHLSKPSNNATSKSLADPASKPNGSTLHGAGNTHDHVRAVARLGIQAAEAIHAAHEYGIVHRDVKPSNLLVDDHGKLWVTDFGLARCKGNAELTKSGDILGTMRYMSPEQARGRGGLIDQRTDIYSLGVTLYELATLHHPAGELTEAELFSSPTRFHVKPLRRWNRHVPVDFETIVMKAIAEFPGERYASAQEFADDMSRFLEGKPILASPPSLVSRAGKWARRHLGVLYAAAAVLLVLLASQYYNTLQLSYKNAETERALLSARENLQKANAVLDRFGTRLVDQLAAIPGADGVRYQLLEDSLDFYQDFAAQATNQPALATDLAAAYSKMGSLSERLGKKQEAIQKHLAARDIWRERLANEASNVEAARNLAMSENNVGLLLAETGREHEAIKSLRHAQQILQGLLHVEGQSNTAKADLATTYSNLGLVLRQTGDRQSAARHFRDAIEIQERLVAESPQSEPVLRGLAASYNNLGSLTGATATDPAIDIYEKAVDIQRRLVRNHPINRIYQGDLARTYNNLGYAHAQRQDWKLAEQCYGDAVRIQESLAKASPLAVSYRRDLAISCNNLGMVQSRVRRFAEAESSFRRALELHKLLLAADSADPKLLSNMGSVYNNLGLLFDRQQRSSDAEQAYRQAITFQRKALDATSGKESYRDLLANHYANYEKCLRSQEKLQAADAVLTESKNLLASQGLQ